MEWILIGLAGAQFLQAWLYTLLRHRIRELEYDVRPNTRPINVERL